MVGSGTFLWLTLWATTLTPEATMHRIFDFTQPVPWLAVNDGVMGGLSQSRFERTDVGGVFSGHLSLENNGGFASVRFSLPEPDLSRYDRVVLRVRGDGRRYQLRLRTDRGFDGVAYRALFDTTPGEWQRVELAFSEFRPTFRGRAVPGADPLATDSVHQVTLMIAEKEPGDFRLEVEGLWAVAAR